MDILDQEVREIVRAQQIENERQPHYINDQRIETDFKGITFTEFKLADCKKVFIKSIVDGRIEDSQYWCAELVCSAHYLELWDIFLLVLGKHVHTGNPKLPVYIANKYELFKETIHPFVSSGTILASRNSSAIRELLCDITYLLCTSKKKPAFVAVKIAKETCFNMSEISLNISAPGTEFANATKEDDDPRELFISTNELAYHVSGKSKNMVRACYWIEWIVALTAQCRMNRTPLMCETRGQIPVDYKFQQEPICLIWVILMHEASQRDNKLTVKIIESLCLLFYIRYTSGAATKRKWLLYSAVEVLTDLYSADIPLVKNRVHMDTIRSNVNIQYVEMKKREVAPATDYLDHGLEGAPKKSAAEKSMDRMALLGTRNCYLDC